MASLEGTCIYWIIKIKRKLRYFIQKMKTGKFIAAVQKLYMREIQMFRFWGDVSTGNLHLCLRAIYFLTHENLCEYDS